MEEEEDRFLLSSLGVTSANPADIEQTILDEATKKLDNDGSVEERSIQLEGGNVLPSSHSEILNRLRAVKFEIDAVASTVEQAEEEEGDDAGVQSGSVLQNALATDRLRSLRKRKK